MSRIVIYFVCLLVLSVTGLVTAFFLAALMLNGSAIAMGVSPFTVCVFVAVALALVFACFATVEFAHRRKRA
ncbi:hypothetical protein [Rhizobium sp. S163]|uniref:hypothetical protein n=1 Tax=Rhizobium sp. S163 TaxID=3055039 RepID=UPI0025A9E852|nr:hypothetical protein [Rhizobium sp. S163]MDM9647751.1 hypothetical protein [Rhizobium sp. S163]